VIKVA